MSQYTHYVCNECGEECRVDNIKVGSVFDEAYGIPKWFNEYEDVSDCCHADYKEMQDYEFEDYTKDIN